MWSIVHKLERAGGSIERRTTNRVDSTRLPKFASYYVIHAEVAHFSGGLASGRCRPAPMPTPLFTHMGTFSCLLPLGI